MTFESAGGRHPLMPAQEEVIVNRIRRDAAQPAARLSRGPGHPASVVPSAAPDRQNRPASTVIVSLLHKLIDPVCCRTPCSCVSTAGKTRPGSGSATRTPRPCAGHGAYPAATSWTQPAITWSGSAAERTRPPGSAAPRPQASADQPARRRSGAACGSLAMPPRAAGRARPGRR